MNQQERDALRKMHADASFWDDPGCSCCEGTLFEACAAGCFEYPCDVIKVLDAWDQRTNGLVSPAQTNTGIPYVEGYQGRQGTQGAWEGTL